MSFLTRNTALLACVIPFLAVHTCYLLAASGGHVDWCFPYIDSCTSISATGRKFPEYFVFKLTMIPSALLMILYWRLNHQWLRWMQVPDSRKLNSIPWMGLVAGVFLIIYVIALGHKGDSFQLMRRTGVTLHFALTYLSALFLTLHLRELNAQGVLPVSGWVLRGMWWICLSVLMIGIAHDLLKGIFDNYEDWEDAVEWNVALLLNLHYLLVWVAWRQTRFQAVPAEYRQPASLKVQSSGPVMEQ